jgi:UDP-GlcNAc:undecaprenyl-phosphate GlcNAc-1-phosphate transferase
MTVTLIVLLLFNCTSIFFKNYLEKKINIYDFPNKRKIHKKKIPLSASIYLIINFLLIFFCDILFLDNFFFSKEIFYYYKSYFSLIFGCLFFFILGITDDKIRINPNTKLLLSVAVLYFLVSVDFNLKIEVIRLSFFYRDVPIVDFSTIFTVLCFALFINSFNMFDGINGQASLYAIFLFILFSYYAFIVNISIYFIIILLVFLYFNIKNKNFLGDGGTLFLSFFLGYFFVKFYNTRSNIEADLIFIAMYLPGVDMFRLFIERLFKLKNPFYPDNQHLHHLLLFNYGYAKTIFIILALFTYPFFLAILFDSNKAIIILLSLTIYVIFLFFLKKSSKTTRI